MKVEAIDHLHICVPDLERARFEEWKTKYYELERRDGSSGWPTRKTLEELGLAKVADELQSQGKLGVS